MLNVGNGMRLDEYISVDPDRDHARSAGAVAVHYGDQIITYGDLCVAIDQTTAYIIADGSLKSGDRIAYYDLPAKRLSACLQHRNCLRMTIFINKKAHRF